MARRTLSCAAALAGALIAAAPALLAQPATAVARLEAALLSKFPQFVEWPPEALADRASIEVCVGAPDPFGNELDRLLEGETLNNRPLVVRRVDSVREVRDCQVLFLPSRPGRRHPLLDAAAALPILTVGDDEDFLEDGGIIRLRVVASRVRFDVNAAAAQRAGLRISSQMLQLALSVVGATP